MLVADKGYTHDRTRAALCPRIRHTMPERSDQDTRGATKDRHGRWPPILDPVVHRPRNVVERASTRLKRWREWLCRRRLKTRVGDAAERVCADFVQALDNALRQNGCGPTVAIPDARDGVNEMSGPRLG
jgi:transposase